VQYIKEKLTYPNFYINLLLSVFLSHVFYKITYIDRIFKEFSLIEQIPSRNVTSQAFFVESPLFALLGVILRIQNFDIYLLFVYLLSLLLLFFIVVNLKYLNEFSTFFILSGWLITCSWFMGHVDILSVLLIILLSKNLELNTHNYKLFSLYLLLSINHNAIGMVCLLVFLILLENKKRIRLLMFGLPALIIGNALLSFYLSFINFSGRGRLRFVFNDGVIWDSINFVGNNTISVFWSGFMGFSVLLLIISIINPWKNTRKIFTALIVAFFFTSIALDTSRIFSLAVIPIILYTINIAKDNEFVEKNLKYIYLTAISLVLIIGPYYLHGSLLNKPPQTEVENFYNYIPRIVNSIMSGIWS
tara:strand:+ start:331 stop:1410 length:1080 start_codon:yes stop_codon:yes gene_type:complete